jgi:hypothetical protein
LIELTATATSSQRNCHVRSVEQPAGLFSDPADAGRIIVGSDRTGQHEFSAAIMIIVIPARKWSTMFCSEFTPGLSGSKRSPNTTSFSPVCVTELVHNDGSELGRIHSGNFTISFNSFFI